MMQHHCYREWHEGLGLSLVVVGVPQQRERDALEGSLDDDVDESWDAAVVVIDAAAAAAAVVGLAPLPFAKEEELHVGLRNALGRDSPVAVALTAAAVVVAAIDDARGVPCRTRQSLRDSLLHDNRQRNDDINCRARILSIDTACSNNRLLLSYRLNSGCVTAPSTHMQEHSKAIRE